MVRPHLRLRPFFSYYGSKFFIAKRYNQPIFDQIIEPFAGSATYSLLYPFKRVHLLDTYECIAGVWQYLIKVKEEEILALPDRIPEGSTVDDYGIPQEAKWLIGFCLMPGGAYPMHRATPWGLRFESKYQGQIWSPKKKRLIASQLKFIRHWKAEQAPYTQAPDIAATWFIDPPYQVRGAKYKCDALDYGALGAWCQQRKGQVLVCENVGAMWLPFQEFHTTFTQGKKKDGGLSFHKEAIYTQGPQPGFFGRSTTK